MRSTIQHAYAFDEKQFISCFSWRRNDIKACMPKTKYKHKGVEFLSNLIVLDSKAIDVILGMNWLTKYQGVIDCAQRLIKMKHTDGTEVEYQAWSEPIGEVKLNQANAVVDIRVV